tara:strand:- start:965 stop:1324 length:360 start_codon:yes stop_codon:yes gene_type:complete
MNKEKAFSTIIVLSLASLIFCLLLKIHWLIFLAIGFLVVPLVSIKMAFIISKVWLAFSNYLGLLMNYILMFFCFYFILIPFASLQKLFGGNQIIKKEKGDSFFVNRNHTFTKEDIKNPW